MSWQRSAFKEVGKWLGANMWIQIFILMQTGMIFFKFPAKNKTFKLNGKIPKICNLSSEFVHYKNLINGLDSASAMSYWKLIGCIPRCSYTKYSLNVLWDSNFDLLGTYNYIPYFQNHKPQVALKLQQNT